MYKNPDNLNDKELNQFNNEQKDTQKAMEEDKNTEIKMDGYDNGTTDEEENAENQISKLSENIKKLEEEVKALKESVLREKAENDNIRKRYSRELEDNSKFAISEFARDLIEVLENLYRAEQHLGQENDLDDKSKSFLEGIRMTIKLLENTFKKQGISKINPKEEKFDPRYHQAISHVQTNDCEENIVIDVIQSGYIIRDRLLREALVVVSKAGS